MRKLRIILLVVVALFVFVGCSSVPYSNASNHSLSVGERAVAIVDEFLDHSITARDARNQIRALPEIDTDAGNSTDFLISAHVFSLGSRLLIAENDSAESYDNVLESRNELAVGLGMRRR